MSPEKAAQVHASLALRTLNATLTHVTYGEVHISAPFSTAFTQQNGFLHGGIVTALADTACAMQP
jgi:acyl-coenzyme A thioesterase PaaI-like protein